MFRIVGAPVSNRKEDWANLAIASVAGLAFTFIAIFLCIVPFATKGTTTRDFIVFWATGRQLIHHNNPYDAAAMKQIEHAAGLPPAYGVYFMRNPPLALPLALPLGLAEMHFANFLWSLILLGCQFTSVWLIWQMHGRPPNRLHWLALSFAPFLICLFMGQTAMFALLGLVLFLRLHRQRPFAAGLSLWLCELKPHLFLPFGVALLVWIVVSKSYKILAGTAVALTASYALTELIYPSAWSAYAAMMHSQAIDKEPIPCLSAAMRQWMSPQAIWLQYLPIALACIWALVFYWRRRKVWDWMQDGCWLMLVSIVVSPYCWLNDQVVVIPALLHGAYTTRSRPLLMVLALVNIPIMAGLILGINLTSSFYLWIAPFWLTWYLFANVFLSEPSTTTAVAARTIDSAESSFGGRIAGDAR